MTRYLVEVAAEWSKFPDEGFPRLRPVSGIQVFLCADGRLVITDAMTTEFSCADDPETILMPATGMERLNLLRRAAQQFEDLPEHELEKGPDDDQ